MLQYMRLLPTIQKYWDRFLDGETREIKADGVFVKIENKVAQGYFTHDEQKIVFKMAVSNGEKSGH